jgi:hypothetical protein
MGDAIYIGTGKERIFSNGSILKMAFNREDLAKLNDALDQNGWVRIDIKKRKEPSAKGQTHFGQLDTWQPDGKQAAKPASEPASKLQDGRTDGGVADDKGKEDLPF